MRPFKRLKQRRKSRTFKLLRSLQNMLTLTTNTHKTVIRDDAVIPDSIVFYDQIAFLGTNRYKPD